jgi:predicted metal-binding membrane protein
VTAKSRFIAGGLFPPVMLGLIALAWAALALWEASPYGRYLDHGNWTQIGLAGAICSFLPQGELLFPLLLYTGGWLLMSAAMMLPTTLPLLEVFRRMTAGRADAQMLLGLVIGGYLLAWAGFGVVAHLLDIAVNLTVRQSDWLVFNGWVLGAAVLALAGAFQFSRLKHYCLTRCRAPLSFVVSRWHGRAPRREALRLGVAHGVFCVGCCWALMLLMFVVGTGSVGWMLALGAVMALEKNLAGNGWLARHLGTAFGIALLMGATAITATHLAA